MNMNEMILVSVDDHFVEPPDMFDAHIPAAYKDKAPKIIHEKGTDFWIYEGRKLPNIGLNAVVGRPPEEYGVEPAAYDQMRKGSWNAKARVDDMNVNGVLGSLGFPTFPGFAGMLFSTVCALAATTVFRPLTLLVAADAIAPTSQGEAATKPQTI